MKYTLAVPLLLLVSACDLVKSPTDPSAPPVGSAVEYTAIGASDAIGYGSSVPCFPYADCPTGTGYVPVVQRRLKAAGKTVTMLNLGMPGAVLSSGTQAIGNSVGLQIPGNFLDAELPFITKTTTLVTIFAGANDTNAIGSALKAGAGGSDPVAYIQAQVSAFGRDLTTLVTGIQAKAPGARIVILNLPNVAGLPYSAGRTTIEKQALQAISVGFTSQINAQTARGALVIDLMCDSRLYDPSIYSSDGFHPNDAGYALFADLVYAAANATPVSAKTSCSQMTLY